MPSDEPRDAPEKSYLNTIMDAIPAPVIIFDQALRVIDCNAGADEFLGDERTLAELDTAGALLGCSVALQPQHECGVVEECRACAIRLSALDAIGGGKVVRQKSRLKIARGGRTESVHLLVTASPFQFAGEARVLMVLEDVTELVQIKELIPICARCKKIRNDQEYWEQVDWYLRQRLDLRFSHGICPDCAVELYPEFKPGRDQGSS